MKKRINLFSQRIDNQTAKKYLFYGKRATYGVLLFGVISLLALFGIYIYLNQNLAELTSKKNTYSRYILSNKKFNQDIQQFIYKFNLLKTYTETDAEGFRYYEHLVEIITPLGIADAVDSFSIDNGHVVSFSLTVSTYDEGLMVLAFFERADVLDHFDSLTLESFDIIANASDYTLSFNGILKTLDSYGNNE